MSNSSEESKLLENFDKLLKILQDIDCVEDKIALRERLDSLNEILSDREFVDEEETIFTKRGLHDEDSQHVFSCMCGYIRDKFGNPIGK